MKKLGVNVLWLVLGLTTFATLADSTLSACPRCRRAAPKGPKKRPHPGFAKKDPAPQANVQVR